MGGWYATRRVVLMLGAESATTGMSLMAVMDSVKSDGANPAGRWLFLQREFQCRIRSRIRSRVTGTMPTLHKLYEIVLCWSSNRWRGAWQYPNCINPYRELPLQRCRNEAPWNAFTNREGLQKRKVHPEMWWQTHQQMNQEAACRSHNPEWDSDLVSAILIQSWHPRHTQLLLEINFTIKPNQLI